MTAELTEQELFDALDGLHAYDSGSVDSGIHDELLRERVKAHLHAMDEQTERLTLSRFIREYYLTEDALAQRYGIEDVKGFIDWLSDYMNYDI